MTNAEIGYRIYIARKENHATLEEVAKKVGLTKSTIQRYEKGRKNDRNSYLSLYSCCGA